MIQLCRHILASNQRCAQPAQNGKHFCRHHRGINAWKRHSGHNSHATPTQTYDHGTMLVPEPMLYAPLELEFPEDRASIQINLYRIIDRLARGLMERSTATALMYGMQVAQTNLGKTPLLESAPAPSSRSRSQSDDDSESTQTTPTPIRTVSRVILTPEGDEIAPPVEILEDNEAEPIHHKRCPCLLCAEKYRNQPPEEHHPACQCGLCEEDEGSELSEQGTQRQGSGLREQVSERQGTGLRAQGTEYRAEHSAQRSATTHKDVILSEARFAREVEGPASTEPATSPITNNDVILSEARVACAVEGPAVTEPATIKGGSDDSERCALRPELCTEPCALSPARRKRVARAAALLSGSTNRDPLNRPWSIAEYTFGDAVRRHEAQYAARAAAALAVGIEPPPYEPYITGLIHPGTPEFEEDQQMQQHSSEYWAAHFRKLIAERPDIQQALDEEGHEEEGRENANP